MNLQGKPPGWYPPILTYHCIGPAAADTPTVSPEAFDHQMAILTTRWSPISLSHLIRSFKDEVPLPHRAVVVTFDDGTEDTFTQAFPILQRHQVPATVFLIADKIGQRGFLSKDQVQEMRENGIQFGSHGLSHAYLPELSLSEAQANLTESMQQLQAFGVKAETFSYPAGGFTEEILSLVQSAGYQAACTTNRGFARSPINRWALRRISIHNKTQDPIGMWLKCSGYHGINRRLRSPA